MNTTMKCPLISLYNHRDVHIAIGMVNYNLVLSEADV